MRAQLCPRAGIRRRIAAASAYAQLPCTPPPRRACTAAMRYGSCTQADAPTLFIKFKWKPKLEACRHCKTWIAGCGGSRRRRGEGQSPAHGVRVRAPKPKASRGREGRKPLRMGDELPPKGVTL